MPQLVDDASASCHAAILPERNSLHTQFICCPKRSAADECVRATSKVVAQFADSLAPRSGIRTLSAAHTKSSLTLS